MIGNRSSQLHRGLGIAGALLLAGSLAIGGCGGDPEPRPDDRPPPVSTPVGSPPVPPAPTGAPKGLEHTGLQQIQSEIQEALLGATPPNFAGAAEGAGKLTAGADAILKDAPASLKDDDRLRYEGLVAQVKERAAGLKAAADAKEPFKAKRSFQQLTASCVKCHSQFGQQPAPAGEGK